MKLSEAILLSIGVVKNDSSIFLTPVNRAGVQGPCGCAIGTALHSVGYVWGNNGIESCHKEWPWTKQKGCSGETIAYDISLRHSLGESRESLAKWIATIEPQNSKLDFEYDYTQEQIRVFPEGESGLPSDVEVEDVVAHG